MKLLKTLITATLCVGLTAQAADVSIPTARGEATLPQNPSKIAVYDMSALDTIDALGVKVGATIDKKFGVAYLDEASKGTTPVGQIKTPDIEALHGYQPDLVVVGGRTSKQYDDVKKYFPNTIDMSLDGSQLVSESLIRLESYGKLFNKTDEAEAIKSRLSQLFSEVKTLAKDKGNGLIILINGNKMSAYGPQSRLGWIHRALGIAEADKNIKEASHGQPISFEYIKKTNPDWLFVLDRAAAIGKDGVAAEVVLDNPLVAETTAWKKGQVVYFSPAAYLAPGGVRQMETDANTIKTAFEK